ncbi:DUF4258 domain-containing protein [Arenimonas sp.]|uniref:DUF4258 domain-containing protein n=1 Tax=Arenimonas sp. TaxID=1872635 RepID=UPI0025C14A1F|nr:DUF4258 domain-containing protein [Arenimonas sp.]
MKDFKISSRVLEKLQSRHQVTREEVLQAFMNREGPLLTDNRLDHRTDPPTIWFCAPTDRGRLLKVIFVERDEHFEIKSAYEPTDGSDRLYERIRAKKK